MAKHEAIKKKHKAKPEEEFYFSNDIDSLEEEVSTDLMSDMIETCQHRQMMAMELTRLIVEKGSKALGEEEIFAIFKRASNVVAEDFALELEKFWECMKE